MQKALRIAAWAVGIPVTLVAVLMALSWSKRHIDLFVPVKGARLTVDGLTNRRMSLFKSTHVPFTTLPTRTMVLIQNGSDRKERYVILGPGPGHLQEGFKGSVRRCESVFVATPLFGFADDYSECSPVPNRDGDRRATFGTQFVEFSTDDGKRLRLEW